MTTKRQRDRKKTLYTPLVRKAIAFTKEAMKGKIRHDGVTPLHRHPLTVLLILHDLLGVRDERTLVVAVLHDTPEDTDSKESDVRREFGTEIARRVKKLTYIDVSETGVPDANARRRLRYKAKLAHIRNKNPNDPLAFDTSDCLVTLADILSNDFTASGTVDAVMLSKPPYWKWSFHSALPALEKRLRELKWLGVMPSHLVVTGACRYVGPLPLFDKNELDRLERLDAIE